MNKEHESILRVAKMKEADERFDLKAGDFVLVDMNYDWDSAKVVCVGKLEIRNTNSLYKDSITFISSDDLLELK